MTDSKREAARTERALKFDAVVDTLADRDALQADVARAVTDYGSACFRHGEACAQ